MATKEQKAQRIKFRSPKKGFRCAVPGRQPYHERINEREAVLRWPEGHTIEFVPYRKSDAEMGEHYDITDRWGSEYTTDDPLELEALRRVARKEGVDMLVEVGPVE